MQKNILYILKCLIKKYRTFKEEYNNQYQKNSLIIQKITQNSAGKYSLRVKVIGKNISFQTTPEKLARDDKTMEHFSRKDVRTITYFATKHLKQKPRYIIQTQEFCNTLNKSVYLLRDLKTGESLRKTSDEISGDSKILQELSKEDAHRIGYSTGTEKTLSNHEPKYFIAEQQFSLSLQPSIFIIEDIKTKQKTHMTAQQILETKIILSNLSKDDIKTVSYFSGIERATYNYTPTYKIIDQEISTALGEVIFVIEEIITSKMTRMVAQQIIEDKKVYMGLGREDARLVSYLAGVHKTANTIDPEYRIIGQEYSNISQDTIFLVEKISAHKTERMSAKQIINNIKILNKLSKQDHLKIGYIASLEK